MDIVTSNTLVTIAGQNGVKRDYMNFGISIGLGVQCFRSGTLANRSKMVSRKYPSLHRCFSSSRQVRSNTQVLNTSAIAATVYGPIPVAS